MFRRNTSRKFDEMKNMNEELPENVPFIVYESAMARADRRLFWVSLLAIIAVATTLITNVSWIYYESLFDTYEYTQDGNGVNTIITDNEGDVKWLKD